MTLDEAIKHCLEVADEQEKKAKAQNPFYAETQKKCFECAKEHRQLASWLKALKEIWDSGDCNDCKFSGHCDIQPKVGQLVRFNCYHFSREDEQMEIEEVANYLQELSDYIRKLLECPSAFEEDEENG